MEDADCAETFGSEDETIEEGRSGFSERMESYMDAGHRTVSKTVRVFSEWVDNFFGDPRTEIENRYSRLRLRTGPVFTEDGFDRYEFNVNLNLVLPRTERRLNLVFQGSSEDTPGADTDNLPTAIGDTDYAASVFYRLRDTVKLFASIDVGARFSIPTDPFVRLRLRKSFFPGAWEIRGTENLRYFALDGLESIADLDFDRKFARGHLLRSRSRAEWTEQNKFWNLSQTLSVFQIFGQKTGLTWEAQVSWDTDVAHIATNAYLLRLRFRRQLWRRWIFFEVEPEANFPRSEGFDFTPALRLRLELLFGKGLERAPNSGSI